MNGQIEEENLITIKERMEEITFFFLLRRDLQQSTSPVAEKNVSSAS
jgi:hypothetical protein